MTTKLVKLLTDFFELIKDWNSGIVANEEIFIDKIRKLVSDISEELENQKEEKIQLRI